ncbi:hypothetical protein SUGI_0939690 [Cryptomeria japonica]|nr:hypothetical protein SUGI_0939690 [Cryptomeria japonica]
MASSMMEDSIFEGEDEPSSMTMEELTRGARLLDTENRILKDEVQRTTLELDGTKEKIKAKIPRQIETSLGRPLDSEPQVPPAIPLVIVISGPCGVGNDVVIKRLHQIRKGQFILELRICISLLSGVKLEKVDLMNY